MIIGNKEFDTKSNVYVMGILNFTPDSFSDGSKYNTLDKALIQVERMINEGADIIDVGGESTRPGHIQISEEEEIDRVVPLIKAIKDRFDIPVSIDTYKANVAVEAFKAGADLLNDIWGLLYEKNIIDGENKLAKYAKDYNVAVCLMHNDIEQMRENNMDIVIDRLQKSVDEALKYGINKDKIMLDPGIGFVKSYENNLYVMKHMEKLNQLQKDIYKIIVKRFLSIFYPPAEYNKVSFVIFLFFFRRINPFQICIHKHVNISIKNMNTTNTSAAGFL